MLFDHFLTRISHIQHRPLGGWEAQKIMAPSIRLDFDIQKIKTLNPRKAAVMALVYPDAEGQSVLLLTKRAAYNGTHSAQISFPGGKTEPSDDNLAHTALRETHEEVGVNPDQVAVIRELSDVYIPPSNFLATPFLGCLEKTPKLTKNFEVNTLIELPLKELLDDKNLSTTSITNSYATDMEVPCFSFDGHIVWGATAMMLNEIKVLFK